MLSQVNRNASDGSQALAIASASQGQASQGFADLAGQEANWKRGMLQMYNQANQAMTQETGKVYSDQLRKYNNDVEAKTALRNAAWSNLGSAIN